LFAFIPNKLAEPESIIKLSVVTFDAISASEKTVVKVKSF
jgi:hypothetical protein